MTRIELIDLLATGRTHATKLNAFRKEDLERFVEEQTDPTNHSPFKPGDFVYCEWADRSGVVTGTQKVPGRTDDRHNLFVKAAGGGYLHTHTGDVIRYQD
jgi:hypothetical protein